MTAEAAAVRVGAVRLVAGLSLEHGCRRVTMEEGVRSRCAVWHTSSHQSRVAPPLPQAGNQAHTDGTDELPTGLSDAMWAVLWAEAAECFAEKPYSNGWWLGRGRRGM